MTPELKTFDSGTCVCRFSVADRAYVKPEKGEEEAPGQFYEVEVWGKYAQICTDRILKGSRVAVNGTAVWREYQVEGSRRKAFLIRNPEVTFMDTKAESEALAARESGGFESANSGEIPF